MHKLSIVLLGILVLAAFPAVADQLTLGGDGTVYFCSTGGVGSPIVLSSTSATCATTGGDVASGSSGSFEAPTGTTMITLQPWSFGLPTFGWTIVPGGKYEPSEPTSTNTFSWGGAGGAGAITGDLTWTLLKDGTSTPQLVGNLLVTGNANTGLLLADFPVGRTLHIDYTFNLDTQPTLDDVFYHCVPDGLGGCSSTPTSTYLVRDASSGQVPGVPEPGAVTLLGAGLLVAGTYLRRKGRVQVG